jgi:hypothetical protein
MQGYMGEFWRVDASDPDVIKGWLIDRLRLLVSSNMALGPVRLTIYPLYGPLMDGGHAQQDWPAGGTDVQLTPAKLADLAQWLEDNSDQAGVTP